jgi:hypothetical protein
MMPRKPDDPEQSARFVAFAKEHGADEETESFERGFKVLAPMKRPPEEVPKGRSKKSPKTRRKA